MLHFKSKASFSKLPQQLKRSLSTSGFDDKSIVCVSFARTPIGNYFSGKLATVTAPRLGAHVIESVVTKSGIQKSMIEEVYMGNVVTAGVGQAPARQASIYAGLPKETVCTTINKVCASGMKATMLASMSISSGYRNVVISGGMESMSNIPHYLMSSRNGYRLGNTTVIDGLIHDGLWDVYNNQHMGNCAELCATKYNITRKDQDEFSKQSNLRAIDAWKSGKFNDEVAPITVTIKKKEVVVSQDEGMDNFEPSKMESLKPAFFMAGSVTAASSSKISDGAAAMILMSGKRAKELNLKPLFKIRGFGDAAQDPVEFTTAPSQAVPHALRMAGVTLKDIDYHEVNEAFAVVTLANSQLLGLDLSRVNVFGGAVALGHPIGCSGARIIGTLYSVLKHNGGTLGCASICNGGGGASAIVIERLS